VDTLGRTLLAVGLATVLPGGLLLLRARHRVSRLPGDIVYRRGNFTLIAPLGLMILLSVVLTVAPNLFLRR
jgi:hypothetical protein